MLEISGSRTTYFQQDFRNLGIYAKFQKFLKS